MKQIAVIFLVLANSSLALGQSNSLQEGNNCYVKGNYTCAIEKYREVIKSSDERQKKIANDNLKQAEMCFDLIRMADSTFNSKNYVKAKEFYKSVLDENFKDEYAKARLNEINLTLSSLSVSKNEVLFSNWSENEVIHITTNADPYSVKLLSSWCSVKKFEKHFVVTCTENESTLERMDTLTVSAGGKTAIIHIRQKGKQVITPSVSEQYITFNANGGNSKQILVYANTEEYSITLVPAWFTVLPYNGYIIVNCSSNNGSQSRSDWFRVTAGNRGVIVHVTQDGGSILKANKSDNPKDLDKAKSVKCFNCPKSKDFWGLTSGYSQLNYDSYSNLHGVHLGLRLEPLFKYGFGLNTGLIFNAYLKDVTTLNSDLKISYYGISVPLHLEYRFNFSKKFNLFLYGGVGFNALTDYTFKDNDLPATLEYGGGFRVGHVQFNFGKSSYLGDYKNIEILNKNLPPFQSLVLFISYLF